MEKYELSYEKDEEIIKIIKDIVLSRHPILENRMDVLFKYPSPSIDIKLNFYQNEDNKNFTQVMFCDGTENMKCSIPEEINVNGLISFQTIIKLINFILSDHDYIKNIYKIGNEIRLSFAVNLKDDNMCGISCGIIELSLDFKAYPDYEEILNNYLKVIISNFYEKLKHTENFKREYSKYCSLVKEKIINSLSEDDLHLFINLLNNEDLCNILLNIPNDRFMELYNDFKNKKGIMKKLL